MQIIHDSVKTASGKEYEIRIERLEQKPTEASASEPTPVPKVSTFTEPLPEPPEDPDASLMTDPLNIVKSVFGNAEVL